MELTVQKAKGDAADLRKQLEDEIMHRLAAENRVKALGDELAFNKQL